MHSSWYNVFKGYKVRTDNINMHAVKLQTIKLLTMFSPDKTLYSEILLPAFLNQHNILSPCNVFLLYLCNYQN